MDGKKNFTHKARTFIPPDSNHIINILNRVKNAGMGLVDIIDQTVNDRTVHISDNRGEIAKDMVNAAMNTLFSYDRNGFAQSLRLSQKDQRRVLVMIDEVLSGKREAIQFQLTRNCDGIKEMYSKEVFTLEDRKK